MENLKHFDYTKELYNYSNIEKYFLKDNNVYYISDFMIFNGKIYQNGGFNICWNLTCNISKATFKSIMNKKFKDNNYFIRRLNLADKTVRNMFNYDNISKKYMA